MTSLSFATPVHQLKNRLIYPRTSATRWSIPGSSKSIDHFLWRQLNGKMEANSDSVRSRLFIHCRIGSEESADSEGPDALQWALHLENGVLNSRFKSYRAESVAGPGSPLKTQLLMQVILKWGYKLSSWVRDATNVYPCSKAMTKKQTDCGARMITDSTRISFPWIIRFCIFLTYHIGTVTDAQQ